MVISRLCSLQIKQVSDSIYSAPKSQLKWLNYLSNITVITAHPLSFPAPSSITKKESPANAKGTRDSSACMKAHCEQT